MTEAPGIEVEDPYTGDPIHYVVLRSCDTELDVASLRSSVDPGVRLYLAGPLDRLDGLPLASVYIRRSLHPDRTYAPPLRSFGRLPAGSVIEPATSDVDRRFAAEQLEIALEKGNRSLGLSTSWISRPSTIFHDMLTEGAWRAMVCRAGATYVGHITWEDDWTNDVVGGSMPRIIDAAPAAGFESIGCATVLTGHLLDVLKHDHGTVIGEVSCLGFQRPTALLADLATQGWTVDHALAIVDAPEVVVR